MVKFKQVLISTGIILFSINAFAGDFKLSSPNLKPGGEIDMAQVFNGFGCTGKNVSPELNWSGAPAETKSFALTVYDPDAPTGSGWWHWIVFNIPSDTKSLASGAGAVDAGKLPGGTVQSKTDYGKPGYGGPCPPPGDKPHRYIFTIYALKTSLDLTPDSSGALVGYYIGQNKIAEASITSKFHR